MVVDGVGVGVEMGIGEVGVSAVTLTPQVIEGVALDCGTERNGKDEEKQGSDVIA